MKERRVVKGVVLRAVDTKESDKILTVLTAELGKVPVVAKGARSRKSRIAAAAQLISYSEMVLSESHGWQILSEASTLSLFPSIGEDILLLSLASYLAELTDAVTYEGTESGDILSHLLNALYALDTLKRPPQLVKAAFELRLMALTGFEPLADGCAVCGAPQPEQPMLDVVHGQLHCGACRQGGGLSMPLTAGALDALRHILYGNPKRLYSFTLGREDLACLGHVAEAYVAAQLERGFRTLDFYKSMVQSLEQLPNPPHSDNKP